MFGANMDITGRRLAEEGLRAREQQLQALAGSLFEAQEEERRRMARELHDDFNQRLAMLANEVVTLNNELCSDTALRQRLESLRGKLDELSDDLRRVAHRLHPSALEHLGLVAGSRILLLGLFEAAPDQAGIRAPQHTVIHPG